MGSPELQHRMLREEGGDDSKLAPSVVRSVTCGDRPHGVVGQSWWCWAESRMSGQDVNL
jgi:hypothetical protein